MIYFVTDSKFCTKQKLTKVLDFFPIFTVKQTFFKKTPVLSGRMQTLKLSPSMTQNQAAEIFYY